MVHFTGLLENARHPVGGPWCWTLLLDPCKNWLPARIGGWPGTATGGQIHVVHISHTHPPKEIIQALRKYLLGKKVRNLNSTQSLFATQNSFRSRAALAGRDRCTGGPGASAPRAFRRSRGEQQAPLLGLLSFWRNLPMLA